MRDLQHHIKLQKAHESLNLKYTTGEERVTVDQIQHAFRTAAHLYHPDGNHPLSSPEAFRACNESRAMLLKHYSSEASSSMNPPPPPRHWYQFEPGFPHKKLRLLSVRQNLSIRAFLMVTITAASIYNDWYSLSGRKEKTGYVYDPTSKTVKMSADCAT